MSAETTTTTTTTTTSVKTIVQTLSTTDPLVRQLISDDLYKQFLDDSFDDSSKTITTGAAHSMSINEQIIKIMAGIDVLNKCVQQLVANKYDDLLVQSCKVDTLQDVLKQMQMKIQLLLTQIQKIRSKLVDPYDTICRQIAVLNRLQVTCDLLRQSIRIIHLLKSLRDCPFDVETEPSLLARQLTKAGQYLCQIEDIVAQDTNGCLHRIDVIKQDLKSIGGLKLRLIDRTDQLMSKSLDDRENGQLAAALQVYYNLNVLDEKVGQLVDQKQNQIRKAIATAMDTSALSQSKSSTPGRVFIPMTIAQSSTLRSTLRQNLDTLIDKIFDMFCQINLVYKLLNDGRDSLTNSSLVDQLTDRNIDGLNSFWTYATKSLSEQLCKAANESQAVRQALETEFPNYLQSLGNLWQRIGRENREINAERILRSSVQAFESAYLSRSLSLLFDSVNKVFADAKESSYGNSGSNTTTTSSDSNTAYLQTVPSDKDIKLIVRHISGELLASSGDSLLCQSVAKNVSKTINLFVLKSEQLSSTDGNSTQVIGSFTASQRLNSTIVDRLQMFRLKITNLLATTNCPPDYLKLIEQSLTSIDNLMYNTLNPMFDSISDAIEAILLTMHSENYSDDDNSGINDNEVKPSQYMKELQTFIARISSDYLSQFPDCDVTNKCVERVANRTIELFLRHISLVRPLSRRGRMIIAADFAQLEMALTPLCQPISRLGRQYRVLRSFKPLLIQTPESIAKSCAIGDLIAYPLIIQFLISNYAPNEIKSAHHYMNWSLTRYNKWLDQHTDDMERLTLIKNSLESYIKTIRQSDGKSFASVYPILIELLQKGLQKSSEITTN
ncbi:conserved oligomeric Golgi complex subunit 5-like [Oppia nitens]|uniref:conserved oligomeric Golgi complex subunit 5-like n=1 Tax=Oppia nitens TaxID=1686743 RepID=UPI0023DC0D7A|nr:conserved oligomeric Golgi complex subunit 5-like [Oppia nitens]